MFRYRLRTLFLLVSVCACGLALFAARMQSAVRQRNAVAELRKKHWVVRYEWDSPGGCFSPSQPETNVPLWLRKQLGDDFFTGVKSVATNIPHELQDAELDLILTFPRLKELYVFRDVSDDMLDRMGELRELENLDASTSPITKRGLKKIATLQQLKWLRLDSSEVGDDDLSELRTLPRLETLHLADTNVSRRGIATLCGMPALRTLDLSGCVLLDATAAELARLSQLEELDLSDTKIAWKELVALKKLLPHCHIELDESRLPAQLTRVNADDELLLFEHGSYLKRELSLVDCRISDSGLAHLSTLTELDNLRLEGTAITDESLKHIAKLFALSSLDVSYTPITDAGLPQMAKLEHLCTLNLTHTNVCAKEIDKLSMLERLTELKLVGCPVTDEAIASLAKLTRLKGLALDETKVTEEGIRVLRQALPDCEISWGAR